jgi:hypothetical protein
MRSAFHCGYHTFVVDAEVMSFFHSRRCWPEVVVRFDANEFFRHCLALFGIVLEKKDKKSIKHN